MVFTAGGLDMGKAKAGKVGGVVLTRADREFMTKGERRKQANDKRQAVDKSERVGPTPETEAKLLPDPLVEMHRMGIIDTGTRDAALELRAVHLAIAGHLGVHARGEGGRAVMSDAMAWIYSHRYKPWMARWARLKVRHVSIGPAAMDMIVEGRGVGLDQIAQALADYARIRRDNPLPPADRLAMVVG